MAFRCFVGSTPDRPQQSLSGLLGRFDKAALARAQANSNLQIFRAAFVGPASVVTLGCGRDYRRNGSSGTSRGMNVIG